MSVAQIAAAVLLAVAWIVPFNCAGYQLGRLFTTPQQRHELDELRNAEVGKPKQQVAGSVLAEPAAPKAKLQPVNSIRVRGVLTRSDGENTAWINDGNTYQGNPESGAIRVTPGDVHSDKVTVVMPDGHTSVNLKVGETYDPADKRVIDLVPADGQAPTAEAGMAPASGPP
jgi:hypothetical protein